MSFWFAQVSDKHIDPQYACTRSISERTGQQVLHMRLVIYRLRACQPRVVHLVEYGCELFQTTFFGKIRSYCAGCLQWPMSLSIACRLALLITDVAILGHLGTSFLAGASLAQVWQIVTSTFIWQVW